jgi:hypothetical protein
LPAEARRTVYGIAGKLSFGSFGSTLTEASRLFCCVDDVVSLMCLDDTQFNGRKKRNQYFFSFLSRLSNELLRIDLPVKVKPTSNN